jgi:cell division septation protein DedD
LLLLAVVGPGLAGYALVHRQVQRRLLKAVAASSTMAEARAALVRQASTRQRLWGLLGINGLIFMGVLLQAEPLVVGLTRLEAALRSQVAEPVVQPLGATKGATKGATTDAASGVSGPAVGPVVAPVVQPLVVQPDPPAPAVPAVARPVSPDAPVAEPAPAVAGSAVPLPPPGSGVARAPVQRYGINVGLFADAGNARRAHERLRQAGLPATLEEISTVRGPRTRVRVGPFLREDEAEAAALRIRALGLDAVVYPR